MAPSIFRPLRDKNVIRVLQVVAALAVADRIARFAAKAYARRQKRNLFLKQQLEQQEKVPQRSSSSSQQQQQQQPITRSSTSRSLDSDNSDDSASTTDGTNDVTDDSDFATTTASLAAIRGFVPQDASGVQLLDGKTAASYGSYAFTEVAFVYPVTETGASLGEVTSEWTAHGGKNAFGSKVKVLKLETRAGAAAVVHGALTGGALASAFAPSESLVSMVPTLHRIAGERLPAVFNVEARGVDAKGDLSLFVNHSDVVAAASTGVSILSSANPQEAHDLAVASHLAALSSSSPILHFFDGLRTAGEITNVSLVPFSQLALLANQAALAAHRDRALAASPSSSPSGFVPAADVVRAVEDSLRSVGSLTGRSYQLFEYVGAQDATSALVVLAAGSQAAEETVRRLVAAGEKVGLLKVRLFRPWSAQHFLAALPHTVQRVAVLDQASSLSIESYGQLFADVATTFSLAASRATVLSGRTGGVACKELRPEMILSIFANLAAESPRSFFTVGADNAFTDLPLGTSPSLAASAALRPDLVQAVFWDAEGANAGVHEEVSHILGGSLGHPLQSVTKGDAYRRPAATVLNTQLRVATGSSAVVFPASEVRGADHIFLHDASLLSLYNVVGNAKTGATLLINAPWAPEEAEAKLPATLKRDIFLQKITLYLVNASKLVQDLGLATAYTPLVLDAAFLHLAGFTEGLVDLKHIVRQAHRSGKDPKLAKVALSVIDKTVEALKPFAIPADWEIATPDESLLPFTVAGSLIATSTPATFLPTDAPALAGLAKTGSWHRAAWSLMFPEAHSTKQALRPDTTGTFLVTLTENKRVTPGDYDRNVFHMEFDTTGTGLKYEIGDALGVHGHNHPDDVRDFLAFYRLNPRDVLTFRRSDTGLAETRTVEQIFTQYLDIFGRPTKRFYKSLAQWAGSSGERQKLEFLVSAEGEFKARVAETQTYADILQEFTSARPPVEALLEMVPAIKPRHYSIASSMKVHPNSVHLLVVLVDWVTPKGQQRFGQCTRYLAALRPGVSVTVSVKPSVMKLPPIDSTPVVMAGLGTGMAPFRAFIEERAFAKAQGVEVGPMVLYFGSRHRSQEYLYGEELEAYHSDGVLTHLRLAFSRDQKEKVYIQNKIQEDSTLMSDLLLTQKGHFYLCGPTWPAGDVRDAISSAFQTIGGMSAKEAAKTINDMKDHERYVLEVY